mmetsp:Transcript_10206/g.25066  ORF Transcript_10206/g.25066 Transcript_10206/m.25066 type:complete len:193 (-) Transcript_10206:236-814(-)|eukprot:CAMPEP_0114495852 /NCGR_PEP_ID=MMETSP0109-20121206/5447_1 /TAXON_ID=29199 /ORGANISM="Chlorarachnion reptans, Strain CCCM449" /LENGTH=192 /DNA_ID=CAMNT_0001673065 /DNA_START=50 /DNA_END=628 /DNA_ORIENTATION=-
MSANRKIVKKQGQVPTELEENVARALLDLETTSKEFSAELKSLYISEVKEVEMKDKRTAILIFVPYKLHKKFKEIQSRLTRELEKKFNDKHVLFVAQRTVLSKSFIRKSKGQPRPRSRTLTAVHNAILEDIVFPTQIVGKRTICKIDGKKLIKIYLDPNDVKDVDDKLKTFGLVYKALTNKVVEFQFPPKED